MLKSDVILSTITLCKPVSLLQSCCENLSKVSLVKLIRQQLYVKLWS